GHGHHAGEVDHHEVVDGYTGQVLPGGHGAARTAVPEAGVDRLRAGLGVDRAVVGVGALGDGDAGVARDADHGHVAAVGRDVQQHLDVGQRLAVRVGLGPAELPVLLGGPAVRAQQQDVERRLPGRVRLALVDLAVAEVESVLADVRVQVLVVGPGGAGR